MSEQNPETGTQQQDPDADPDNLAPRDLTDGPDGADGARGDTYDGDPDADPENLNPREG